MEAIGLLVTLEARAGKEADAEAFLKSAQPLALNEKLTLKWYAIKLGPGKFGIFDTFANEEAASLTTSNNRLPDQRIIVGRNNKKKIKCYTLRLAKESWAASSSQPVNTDTLGR